MTSINYVNLGAQWSEERDELLPILDEVLASGNYVGGEYVEKFERSVASYCGAKYCVALNSGTDALVCALIACGVRRGDHVITPPNSFIASTSAILHVGAIPTFVDVIDDQSIDVEKLLGAITPKTKAIMPVHLTGRMAKMDELVKIAKAHNLSVIEDSAQSIGSSYKGVLSGMYGDVGCFSAHPLKNLNACGDGGFVVTNDDAISQKIKLMRNHGLVDRNTVESFGYVSRLDSIQAAILSFRLSKLNLVIQKRRENASLYAALLDRDYAVFPKPDGNYYDSFHTFVVQVSARDELIDYLKAANIQTAIHYPIPIHLQPAAKMLGHKLGDFPKTEEQANKIITLPINQFLSDGEITYICENINKFYRGL